MAESGEEGNGQVSREGSEVCLRWAEGDGHPKLTIIVAFIAWICFKMMVCCHAIHAKNRENLLELPV